MVKWVGQLGGKAAVGVAIGIREEAVKEAVKEEGEWNKEALDALFNETV